MMTIYICSMVRRSGIRLEKSPGSSDTDLNEHGKRWPRLTGEALKEAAFFLLFYQSVKKSQGNGGTGYWRKCRKYCTCHPDRPYSGDLLWTCGKARILPVFPRQFWIIFFHHPEHYQPPQGGESCLRSGGDADCGLPLEGHYFPGRIFRTRLF